MTSETEPPTETIGDHAHTIARIGIGLLPVCGAGLAAEIFSKIVTSPIESRRDRWMEMVGERLHALEEAGVDIETLQDNEVFITMTMQASQAAICNHEKEKLEALRNAVMNAALPNSPDESLQQMFVKLVNEFTVWHLRLLHLFQDPLRWFKINKKEPPQFNITSNLIRLIRFAYPEIGERDELMSLIANELNAKGLYSGGSINSSMSERGAFEKRTTNLGDQFLKYISEPTIAEKE